MVPCGQAPHTHALRKQAEWSECRTFILPGSTPQRQRVLLTLDIAMAGQALQARALVLHLTPSSSGGIPCSEPRLSQKHPSARLQQQRVF